MKLSDIMDLDKAVLGLISLHEDNKTKTKYPTPPIAYLYTLYCIEGRKHGESNIPYKDFKQIIDKQKGPED